MCVCSMYLYTYGESVVFVYEYVYALFECNPKFVISSFSKVLTFPSGSE